MSIRKKTNNTYGVRPRRNNSCHMRARILAAGTFFSSFTRAVDDNLRQMYRYRTVAPAPTIMLRISINISQELKIARSLV